MVHVSRNIKNSSAESNGDCDVSIGEFQRGRILESDLETILMIFLQRLWLLFYYCLKNLLDAKLKSFGLMTLADILIQPSILGLVVISGQSYGAV